MSEMAASGGFLVHKRTSVAARAGCGAAEHRWHGGAGTLRGDGMTERCARVWVAFGVRERVQGSAGWLNKGGTGYLGVRTR